MEAADSTAHSSKVIVQCHDPNNLFDRIFSSLEPRLPLSKLHWKSPNRPLRSINQLNVSFIREESKPDAAANARRHQIPGLRQTPFVKVYAFRCDEKEAYRETSRKEIKQWLKGQGISQDGKTLLKGQERHDAYEYIILHVVLPGTAAAAQPKSSKHISLDATDSTDSVNSKSKWTGKSSSTIYDKLRADFSSSSKAPFERVAQVRLQEPSNKQSGGLGPSEIEEQWQDFVEKLKTAILLSFDARVSQYEEDIRDREAQRQLPGWNFCTFFVLKEGLARGFENVGLTEDALTVYDELDAGLDSIVQEQAMRDDSDTSSALLPFSSDLKPILRSVLDNTGDQVTTESPSASDMNLQTFVDLERQDFPFDVERRNYQQRILTNQVSALDFHIYIFTRQIQLLFRHARLSQSINGSNTTAPSVLNLQHDLNVIAEICEKATSFITFAARALRRDLYAAWGGQEGLSDKELYTQEVVVGDLVASWKWTAIMQIFADCHILVLLRDVLTDPLASSEDSTNNAQAGEIAKTNGQLTIPNEELATWAGELFSMARDILLDVIVPNRGHSRDSELVKGLRSKSLGLLHHAQDIAADVFKLFTIHAYQCFGAARRVNASHSMLHALAKRDLEEERVDEAVWWLEHIPNLSNYRVRTVTDRTLLKVYAECLCKQGRLDEYARTLITLLLSTIANPIVRHLPQYNEQSQQALDELFRVSGEISDVELPLESFIIIRSIARNIAQNDRTNGFTLSLALSLRFNATIAIPEVELVMTTAGDQDPNKFTLKSEQSVILGSSVTELKVACNIVTEGWYNPTRLAIKIKNITLIHYFQPMPAREEEANRSLILSKPFPVMIYPHCNSFLVTVMSSSVADLTKPARLHFRLDTRGVDIKECSLRIKPTTAGFRIDMQGARSTDITNSDQFYVTRQVDSHTIDIKDLAKSTRFTFEVPYSTETLMNSVSVKIEAVSITEFGAFSSFYHRSVLVNLPLSINVQDIFQVERLFSRFTAIPSTFVPIKLLRWTAGGGNSLEIKDNNFPQEPSDIFQKLPASWIVETIPQEPGLPKLPLIVHYQCYDEMILNSIEAQMREDLGNSPIGFVTELLVKHLLTIIPSIWTEQDLEEAVLLQEFRFCSFEAMSWHDSLRALSLSDRKVVEAWLRLWHARHMSIPFITSHARIREVRLLVDMPNPSILVSTDLLLDFSNKYVAVGEPIAAKLNIKCVWKSQSEGEIQFDVASHLDSWLVGGKKRGTISSKTGESNFVLILMAQRTGHLLLPSVDVRCFQRNEREKLTSMPIEVESKSQAKSVLVIPSLQSTTVAIDVEGMVSRHWPIESRRR